MGIVLSPNMAAVDLVWTEDAIDLVMTQPMKPAPARVPFVYMSDCGKIGCNSTATKHRSYLNKCCGGIGSQLWKWVPSGKC